MRDMKTVRMRTLILVSALVAIVALAVGSLMFGGADTSQADEHASASEVRVATRALEDGRVEVAVQQRAGGDWGERQLPEARFLPHDAEAGDWHVSSPITALASSQPENIFTGDLPNFDDAVLICAITHQREGDQAFWSTVNRGIISWDHEHPQARVDIRSGATAAEQSQQVRECIDNGAAAIAVTLPDPQGLREALDEAHEAGILITSFNSGVRSFRDLGSLRHVSVDELTAGRVVGEQLNEQGVAGLALCITHEPANIGLSERCEGLEETYAGDVERFSVADTGTADLAATADTITARLRDESRPIGAVVALNAVVSLAARDAVAAVGSDAAVATFDQTPDVLQAIVAGEILFAINTQPYSQGYYIMASTFHTWTGWNALRIDYGVNPAHIIGTSVFTVEAKLYTAENAGSRFTLGQGQSGGGRPGG